MPIPAGRVLTGARLPPRLRDLGRVRRLFVHGELPRGAGVAIVGTRGPTPEAAEFARTLARELSEAGVVVYSGGAAGIDVAAHEGALAAGAPTVVVAPAGFLRPFPPEHRELFGRIVERGGAYASLVADERPAHRGAFFRRNAVLAALCHVLVVVEAPFKSGARNAASNARTLGRPVLAVPSAPWNARGAGCLLELRLGARLCTGARDVMRELALLQAHPAAFLPFEGPVPPGSNPLAVVRPDPNDPGAAILEAVRRGVTTVDLLTEVTGLGVPLIQHHVLTLTLEGVLGRGPSGALILFPREPVSDCNSSISQVESGETDGNGGCATVALPKS